MEKVSQEVENQGRWPAQVRGGLVAMLPKGETGDPEDHRPVTLLSIIYRGWAKVQAARIQAWMAGVGLEALAVLCQQPNIRQRCWG